MKSIFLFAVLVLAATCTPATPEIDSTGLLLPDQSAKPQAYLFPMAFEPESRPIPVDFTSPTVWEIIISALAALIANQLRKVRKGQESEHLNIDGIFDKMRHNDSEKNG